MRYSGTIDAMHAAATARVRIAGCAPLCAVLLVAAIATGCGTQSTDPVRLSFSLNSSLATGCHGIPEPGQLRFYLSNIRMIDAQGAAAPVLLDATASQSASEGIALVSWDGSCAPDTAVQDDPLVSGTVAGGQYEAIEFELGVPFDRNHANPLAAPPPLNVASMFWTWQTGYKFLRLDVGTDWSFHLGSTGCVSESAVRPPEVCRQPNRSTIRLPAAVAFDSVVVVDLDGLLAGLDIAVAENCVEAYGEREDCRQLLTKLGLDADTGQCTDDCGRQTFLRYEWETRRPDADAVR